MRHCIHAGGVRTTHIMYVCRIWASILLNIDRASIVNMYLNVFLLEVAKVR